MHRRFSQWFAQTDKQLQSFRQPSSTGQAGFATTAKVIVVSLCATGIGVLATSHPSHPPQLQATSNPAASVPIESAREGTDPDAELREWLREPQPPTF